MMSASARLTLRDVIKTLDGTRQVGLFFSLVPYIQHSKPNQNKCRSHNYEFGRFQPHRPLLY